MNFSHPSVMYNSVSPQSNQPNMNTFNGAFYPNIMPPYQGMPYGYSNNCQYATVTYQHSQNDNYNQNGYSFSPTADVPLTGPKREYKPLVVMDPSKNEAIDLVEFSKSTKSNSLFHEIKDMGQNSGIVVSVSANDGTGHDQTEVVSNCKENDRSDQPPSRDSAPQEDVALISRIKCSRSIPNQLETLSLSSDKITVCLSDNNLHDRSMLDSEYDSDKGRLKYDRDTLLKISKSPLCRKPDFDCKEITEVQSIKKYNLLSRLDYSTNFLMSTVNGYLPPHLRECLVDKYMETRRYFKSILNKIAPQNFDECFLKITDLITTTDLSECMDCLIEEIFDKAIQEEAYSVTYAKLCTQIANYEDSHAMKWNFKPSLVARCKKMFITPLQEQLDTVREHWQKKADEEKDDKLKNLYQSDIDEKVKKAKDKYFGNIRFIGELYILDLLAPMVINDCVTALQSKRNDEDALLLLCKLLETCGRKFDAKHNEKMMEYITTLTEIVDNEELHVRIKFRLLDIIEMSKRGWSLRTIQAQKIIQPKTLDQVKKDDFDEKSIEASKLSNKSQIRLNKPPIVNNGDLALKLNKNKNQSLDLSSLQLQAVNCLELKPSFQWRSGSGVKNDEWQNVEGKRNTRKQYSQSSKKNTKSSPVKSRDESPTKIDIGGRFAMLHDSENDIDNSNKMSTTRCDNDTSTSSSTRDASPSNLCSDNAIILNGIGIFDRLLETGSLEVNSWSQLSDVSNTIAIWMDKIMEKNKNVRNKVGDELAQLVANGKLSIEDLTKGLVQFSEDIDDLKPDIPLIWTFIAEFLERQIMSVDSDIGMYKSIYQSPASQTDVADCLALCLKYAADRVGEKIVKKVYKKCSWSLHDFVVDDQEFLRSHSLSFLTKPLIDAQYFDQFKDDLISLLGRTDGADIYEFLATNLGPEIIATKACVYFVSYCVFEHVSRMSAENIGEFFRKKNRFFLQILDGRLKFEKETLRALKDCAPLFKDEGLLVMVINSLGDAILSFESFTSFLAHHHQITLDSTFCQLTADTIRSMSWHRTPIVDL